MASHYSSPRMPFSIHGRFSIFDASSGLRTRRSSMLLWNVESYIALASDIDSAKAARIGGNGGLGAGVGVGVGVCVGAGVGAGVGVGVGVGAGVGVGVPVGAGEGVGVGVGICVGAAVVVGVDVGVVVGVNTATDVAAGGTGVGVGLSLPPQAFRKRAMARNPRTGRMRRQTCNGKRSIRRKEEVGISVLLVLAR